MVNKVILIGNLGRDPEVKFTAGGQAVARLNVATSRSWTDKTSGQRKEETEWHEVEVWGKTAEQCGEYLSKGQAGVRRGTPQDRQVAGQAERPGSLQGEGGRRQTCGSSAAAAEASAPPDRGRPTTTWAGAVRPRATTTTAATAAALVVRAARAARAAKTFRSSAATASSIEVAPPARRCRGESSRGRCRPFSEGSPGRLQGLPARPEALPVKCSDPDPPFRRSLRSLAHRVRQRPAAGAEVVPARIFPRRSRMVPSWASLHDARDARQVPPDPRGRPPLSHLRGAGPSSAGIR